MRNISREEVLRRLEAENLWWKPEGTLSEFIRSKKPRPYLDLFVPLLNETSVNRALVLMGPRRVGKTVLIHHAIQHLISSGTDPSCLCYVSVDNPVYNGWGLQQILDLYFQSRGLDPQVQQAFVFFDEIQYLKGWEVHLKNLVDSFPKLKFVASGSAAAALKLKSVESGAGRFTDFLLPPLTFYEFLELLGRTGLVDRNGQELVAADIEALNSEFLKYLNFGGYPEVIFSKEIQADPGRFIKADIIDKVLLRDLPGLYGIDDIQELNYLFTTLAYNSAQEVSLEELSQNSGVAKNTIKRYIEYLEAAFLIKVVHRIDQSARRFQRANFFKVYLTNPSLRAALFSPIQEAEDFNLMGSVAETGIFAQWFHSDLSLHYARWKHGKDQGEVDIVHLSTGNQKPIWAVEVKWTDRFFERPYELKSLLTFCTENKLRRMLVTTKTKQGTRTQDGFDIEFTPTSLYCYELGHNIIKQKGSASSSI